MNSLLEEAGMRATCSCTEWLTVGRVAHRVGAAIGCSCVVLVTLALQRVTWENLVPSCLNKTSPCTKQHAGPPRNRVSPELTKCVLFEAVSMTARLLWTSEVGKQKRWRVFAPLCCRAEMNEKGT